MFVLFNCVLCEGYDMCLCCLIVYYVRGMICVCVV